MTMADMDAVIFCGGYVSDYRYCLDYLEPRDKKLIICADSGGMHARRLGITPDILLGDFDSIAPADLQHFKKIGVEILEYPSDKDKTDSELAVECALGKGCSRISIFGGTGSRMDHSVANMMLLIKIEDAGKAGELLDASNEMMIVGPANGGTITLKRKHGFKVSLLPLTETAEGVKTEGLLYALNGDVLVKGSTWGISNEFTAEKAKISLRSGILLVIISRGMN